MYGQPGTVVARDGFGDTTVVQRDAFGDTRVTQTDAFGDRTTVQRDAFGGALRVPHCLLPRTSRGSPCRPPDRLTTCAYLCLSVEQTKR